jgi:hypothetical protein
MTLGPACERGRHSLCLSGCHFTIRKRIAYWVITKRDLMAPSIQTSMVPSARSHLGSCILTQLETGKRASSGLDTAISHKSGVCGRTKLEPHGPAAAMTLLVASKFLVTAARSRVELWAMLRRSGGTLTERSGHDAR